MKRLWAMILTGMLFIQCNKEKNACSCKNDVCTEVFVTLSVNIKDQNLQPVRLDSFQTVKVSNQNIIHLDPLISNLQKGEYAFISDAQLEKNNLCSEYYTFQGWIRDSLVVEKTIPIINNCCHVEFTSPQEDIIINL